MGVEQSVGRLDEALEGVEGDIVRVLVLAAGDQRTAAAEVERVLERRRRREVGRSRQSVAGEVGGRNRERAAAALKHLGGVDQARRQQPLDELRLEHGIERREVRELVVEILERKVEGELPVRTHGEFEVEALNPGVGRVLDDRAIRVEHRHLQIVVVVVEGGRVDPHLAVGQGGLDADLVARHRFLVEGRLQRERIVAAALVAGGHGAVEHHVVCRAHLEAELGSQRAPTVAQLLERRHEGLEVDRGLAVVLLVRGVAGAGGERDPVAQMPVDLAVGGVERRVEVRFERQRSPGARQGEPDERRHGVVVVRPAQERRRQEAERTVGRGVEEERLRAVREEPDLEQREVRDVGDLGPALFVEAVGTGHPVGALVGAAELELLRPPLGPEGARVGDEGVGRTVDVRVAPRIEVAPTADGREARPGT